MNTDPGTVDPFEENRSRLRDVAYRMLGSLAEADDAVQEAWLRFHRSDTGAVENLGGWLTTVVARVCLDMLRARAVRRAEPAGEPSGGPGEAEAPENPEREAELADSVGLALLVVLEMLPPPERVAFVLHDLFAMPFDEIAPIVGRSGEAARQLASRARRRVQGSPRIPSAHRARQRRVVDAFLAASRDGDLEGLLAVLDPEVVLRADGAASPSGAPAEVRGARAVAGGAVRFASRSRFSRPALIDGEVGVVVAPLGRLFAVMRLRIVDDRLVEMEVVADPDRLQRIRVALLKD